MDTQNKAPKNLRDRKNERGAALVTVLMISFLLLVAVIALTLEASMNTANVTDATAEEQAYYAAESGIQSVVDALRHNPRPNPLIDASKTPIPPDPDAHPANKIDYVKAVRISTSNATTPTTAQCASADPPPDCEARLSRWLNYNWGPDGGVNAAIKDRIALGDPNLYSPLNGFAYKVTVSDPDNVDKLIEFNVDKTNINQTNSASYTFPTDSNGSSLTVSFVPATSTVLPIPAGDADTVLGKFVLTGNGAAFLTSGYTIPSRVRFAINLNFTEPYKITRVIRGYIEPGTIRILDSGNVRIFFDSKVFIVGGSAVTISDDYNGTIIAEAPPATPTGEGGTYRSGFQITPVPPASVGVGAETPIKANMTAPEPIRLVIRSTGFGPRGARKELEAVIQKNYFNGLGAPSPLTLIGPPCTPVGACTPNPNPSNVAPNFVFQPGASTGTKYDGKDVQLKAFLPPIGVTNDTNIVQVSTRLVQPPPNKFNGGVFGTPSNIADELPFWLQNPKNLDDTLQQLRPMAEASGTLVKYGQPRPPSGNGNYGDFANASGLTYVEGDLEFSQEGGGLLVVTGALTFKGGFKFNGLVIVTGQGGILRTGGGSGFLQGNMIVAPYDNWSKTTCMSNALITNKLDCFYAPRYDISGGGSSDLQYNSNTVKNGLTALTNFVKGVAEK